MEDETPRLAEKAQELDDVELALLLCLIAGEHCIIEAEKQDADRAEEDLKAVCANTFGLPTAILHCSARTTLDDFGNGLLIEDENTAVTPVAPTHPHEDSFFSSDQTRRRSLPQSPDLKERQRIANVVIARDLHLASPQVQIQALELICSRRIFTRTAVNSAPKRFLLIALNTIEDGLDSRLVGHLNDHIFISHLYSGADEDDASTKIYNQSNSSTGSVIRSPSITPAFTRPVSYHSQLSSPITASDIDTWSYLATKVRLSSDVRAYLHNIVVFLRMHRAVASGASATATRHLYKLSEALAPIHGLDFITPSLVSLAMRKVYMHRLKIIRPEDDISLQWGSQIDAVKEYLEGLTVEDVIEDVLERVEVPL